MEADIIWDSDATLRDSQSRHSAIELKARHILDGRRPLGPEWRGPYRIGTETDEDRKDELSEGEHIKLKKTFEINWLSKKSGAQRILSRPVCSHSSPPPPHTHTVQIQLSRVLVYRC